MERTAQQIAEALMALVDGDCDTEQFAEEFGPDRTEDFESVGVLTMDEGFRFTLPGGQTVYVTVKVQ